MFLPILMKFQFSSCRPIIPASSHLRLGAPASGNGSDRGKLFDRESERGGFVV